MLGYPGAGQTDGPEMPARVSLFIWHIRTYREQRRSTFNKLWDHLQVFFNFIEFLISRQHNICKL